MIKKIFRAVKSKVSDAVSWIVEKYDSKTLFTSLLVLFVITAIGFLPLLGIDALAIKYDVTVFFGALFLVLVVLQSLKRGSFVLPDRKTSWGLFALFLSTLLSSLFAYTPRIALFGNLGGAPSFLLIMSLVIIFYIATVTFTNFSRVLGLFITAASVYTLVFLHQIIRVIFGPQILSFGFLSSLTTSVVGSWSDFALFSLLIVIFSIICLEVGKFVGSARWMTIGVGILGIVGLYLTNIRWIWILAGSALVLFALYVFSLGYWNKQKVSYEKGRTIPWYTLGAFVLIILGIIFGTLITNTISQARPLYYSEVSPSISSTFQAGIASIKERPIFGTGVGSFDTVWNKVKPVALSGTSSGSLEFTTGYSFITTQLATTGILGLIVWLFIIIACLYKFFIVIRQEPEDAADRFTRIAIITGAFLLSVISAIHYPGITILTLWAVFMGGLWSMSRVPQQTIGFVDTPRKSFLGMVLVFICIVLAGLVMLVTLRKVVSIGAYSSSVKAFARDNNRTVGLQKLVKANQWWPTDFYNRALASQVITEAQNLKPADGASQDAIAQQVQNILSIGVSYAQASVQANQKNYRNWTTLGDMYQFLTQLKIDGAADRAKDAYTKARDLSPHDVTLQLPFAYLATIAGNNDAALQIVQDSIKAYPTSDAYLWMYQRDVAAKDYADAEKDLLNVLNIDTYNPNVLSELGMLYFVQGKYANAVPAFIQSLSINRSQPAVFAYLGVSYEQLGKTDEANKIFDFLKKQLPDQAQQLIDQARKQNQSAAPATPAPTTKTAPAAAPKKP